MAHDAMTKQNITATINIIAGDSDLQYVIIYLLQHNYHDELYANLQC